MKLAPVPLRAWLACCVVAFTAPILFPLVRVTDGSMEPALPSGSRIVVNVTPWLIRRVRSDSIGAARGARVLFRLPDSSDIYIKRVIGLPGDTIEINRGTLLRNGHTVRELYLENPMPVTYSWPNSALGTQYITVPRGTLFVLGDNRAVALDSRLFGSVPEDDVVATCVLRLPQ